MVFICKNKRIEFCKNRRTKKTFAHNTLIHSEMGNIPPLHDRIKFCTRPNHRKKNPAEPAG